MVSHKADVPLYCYIKRLFEHNKIAKKNKKKRSGFLGYYNSMFLCNFSIHKTTVAANISFYREFTLKTICEI